MKIDGNFTELVNIKSPFQHIHLIRHTQRGLMMLLDSAVQFFEDDEYRYHECLSVVPMLFCGAKSVFIGGGGDGLAAARLLRFPELCSITVCDYDHVVTDLSRTQRDLTLLNNNSLSDQRVTVTNQDAMDYIQNTDDVFDLIICDFPDPLTEELSRLYSQEFYEYVYQRLSERGLVCVQTPRSERCSALIHNTIQSIFPHTLYYRTYYRVGWSGFTLGSKNPLRRVKRVPKWTRYLDDPVVDSLFAIPKDERCNTDQVNTLDNSLLARIKLLDVFQEKLSYPYRYNPIYRVITVHSDIECPPYVLPNFIRYFHEIQPLILRIDHNMYKSFRPLLHELGYQYQKSYRWMHYSFTPFNVAYLSNFLHEYDNGCISKIEAFLCRTDENAEMVTLLGEYFDRYADKYFEIPKNYYVLQQRKLHLVARNTSGKVVMVVTCFLEDDIYMDIVYGRGSFRENMLGLAYCLLYLKQEFKEGFFCALTDDNLELCLKRIGGQSIRLIDIFTK